MKPFDLYINGKLRPAEGGKYFNAVNPSTGEVFARVADGSKEDMKEAVAAARRAFDQGPWAKMSVSERGVYLKLVEQRIRKNAKELADFESWDVGKTIKHATFIDVPTCADTFGYFSKIDSVLEDKENNIEAPVKSILSQESIGVVGCIIPWNYPLIMAAWKMAPALIAGNTIVFKPSRQASVSILQLARILSEVGFPAGVVNIVSGKGRDVGAELAASPGVDMITFTGGTETGKEIIKISSENTKKMCLELGGKSPNIVFADCDFEAALGGTLSAIFMNQGQMCTAGSRLLLQEDIYDKFLAELVTRTKKLKIGRASEFDTDFGPLISDTQRRSVLDYIEKGKSEGAKLLTGGKIPESSELQEGFYLEPTIFGDVKNEMTIAQEEIFGPVLSVIKFSSTEEAVRIANDSKYGLAAMVWTKDLDKADSVSKSLRCGTVWVNTYGGFYNEAPFGGYKQSGFGRELGLEGLLEYTQTKHICMDQTPGGRPLVSNWF